MSSDLALSMRVLSASRAVARFQLGEEAIRSYACQGVSADPRGFCLVERTRHGRGRRRAGDGRWRWGRDREVGSRRPPRFNFSGQPLPVLRAINPRRGATLPPRPHPQLPSLVPRRLRRPLGVLHVCARGTPARALCTPLGSLHPRRSVRGLRARRPRDDAHNGRASARACWQAWQHRRHVAWFLCLTSLST